MRSLRDKKGCFSLAALIGNEIAKFVFESWEEKRASKDIVSWEQGLKCCKLFQVEKLLSLLVAQKEKEESLQVSKHNQALTFQKGALDPCTLVTRIKFHPKLSGGINHVSLVDVKLETLVKKAVPDQNSDTLWSGKKQTILLVYQRLCKCHE